MGGFDLRSWSAVGCGLHSSHTGCPCSAAALASAEALLPPVPLPTLLPSPTKCAFAFESRPLTATHLGRSSTRRVHVADHLRRVLVHSQAAVRCALHQAAAGDPPRRLIAALPPERGHAGALARGASEARGANVGSRRA